MSNLCFIKRVDGVRWHGKSQKDYPSQPETYEAYIDLDTRKYVLVFDDESELKDLTKTFPDLANLTMNEKGHPLFSDPKYHPRLNDGTTTFDLSVPADRLRCAIARGLPQVAPSEAQLMDYPNAKYYVWSIQQEASKKSSVFEKQAKAFDLLAKLPAERKCDLIVILARKIVPETDTETINAELSEIMDKQIDELLVYAQLSRDKIERRGLVSKAIQINQIFLRDNKYMFGDIPMGRNIDEVVDYLNNPSNSDILNRIRTVTLSKKLGVQTPSELVPKNLKRNERKGNAAQGPDEDIETGQQPEENFPV